jgi:AraC family transcriptional activator of mtrCDE
MDAMSDILRMIRLTGVVYFRSDFTKPWGMSIDKSNVAQFHLVARGRCYLYIEEVDQLLELTAGDAVVFPHGGAHWLADEPDRKKIPGMKVVQSIKENEPIFQDGDDVCTTLVCGHFEFDRDIEHPFIEALPKFIHVSDSEQRQFSWLENAIKIILQETDSGNPGAEVVVERLAEVLFIQLIRSYIISRGDQEGFLAALNDRDISNALKLMHSMPQEPWTLVNISKKIGMSRSSFAERFKKFVGTTPMDYLTKWRMQRARDLLTNSDMSLGSISRKIGYTSEPAFNRAFKKRFNKTPGALRRAVSSNI